nr:replication helicase subunit [Acromitus sp. 1 MKL-2023]
MFKKKISTTLKQFYINKSSNTNLSFPALSFILSYNFSQPQKKLNTHIPTIVNSTNNPVFIKQSLSKRSYMLDVNSLYPYSLINQTNKKNKTTHIFFVSLTKPNFERTPFLSPNLCVSSIKTSQEILYSKSLNYVPNLPKKISFHSSLNTLTNVILHIYQKKKTHKQTSKLILNSIYGKLLNSPRKRDHHYSRLLANMMLSSSRISVHKLKNSRNNPCLYSDTDSIFLRHPSNLPLSQNIGSLKSITPPPTSADLLTFYAPRIYTYTYINSKTSVFKGNSNFKIKPIILPKDSLHVERIFYNKYNYKHAPLKNRGRGHSRTKEKNAPWQSSV